MPPPASPRPPLSRTCGRSLRGLLAAALALPAAGCESALFAFANRGLAPPDATVAYDSSLGLSLDVYRPAPGALPPDGGMAPTVVFFYGGAWRRGERSQYQFVGRRLAELGVLAIVADYRTFPQAGFPAFVEDAAQAVAHVRRHAGAWGGDGGRLYLAGHSAGAQIAALLGTDARYLRAHGLQPADLAGVVGLSGPYDFVVSGRLREVFGPPAQWPRAQPLNFVDGDEPAFLLVHGARDRTVESRDAVLLAERLRVHGVQAELVLLPDAGHAATLLGLYDPARAPRVVDAIRAFVHRPATTARTRPDDSID